MNNKICMFSIFLSAFSGVVFASPANITVDVRQLSSGELVINGTGFGADAPNVVLFDRFEDDTAKESDLIPLTGADVGAWDRAPSGSLPLYNAISHSGKFSAQMYSSTSPPDNGLLRQFGLDLPSLQEIYFSYWVRLPDGATFPGNASVPGEFSTNSSWKFTWLYDLDRAGNSSDLCLPTHVGGGLFYLAGNDYNLETRIGNDWWSWNTWMRIAVWLRADPIDPTAPGDVIFQVISSENQVHELRLSKPVFDTDGVGPKQFQHLDFLGWMKTDSSDSAAPLYDDIYVAIGENSVARVELTNSSDYEKSRKVAVQIVTSWSDTRIAFNVNEGNIGDISKKAAFIFVWDKDGNRNIQGIPVLPYPKQPLN